MIPKIIHYCWFGGNPLSELSLKCIGSWKKYFPDHEIREWNEHNYDVRKIPYISEAYDAKKYAFVSDYARFDILYEFGGIYFDVDVEVIRPFGKILEDTGFIGVENIFDIVSRIGVGCNAGLGVGCNAGLGVVKEILEHYAEERFLLDSGKYNLKNIVERVTEIFVQKGFDVSNSGIQKIDGITIYPAEYFCPKSTLTGFINITDNTVSIHHYDGSWLPHNEARLYERKRGIYSVFGENILTHVIVGIFVGCNKFCAILINFTKRFFAELGPINTVKYYWKRIIRK